MKKHNKIIKIILIIIWMIIVYSFSAQPGIESSDTSQSFTIFIIRIFTGGVELETTTLEIIEGVIRKLAHYSIYTIGGLLIMNYSYSTIKDNKKNILYSIMFGAGYAITDELHQYFVPGRSARMFDVGIDTLGVITGVLIYIVIRKTINAIKNNSHKEN